VNKTATKCKAPQWCCYDIGCVWSCVELRSGQTIGNTIGISPSPISNPHQRTRVHLQSPHMGYELYLTTLSAKFQLYLGRQFYWLMKPEYPEKTTDMSQVTDKLYHIIVLSTPHLDRIRTHNVSGDRHWLHKRIHQLKKSRQFQENLSFFNSVDIIILGIVLYWYIYIYLFIL
jgi:hypothetical protein